jgi:hypothetical protein
MTEETKPTPRTDAAAAERYAPDGTLKTTNLVSAYFARELERENAELRGALADALARVQAGLHLSQQADEMNRSALAALTRK